MACMSVYIQKIGNKHTEPYSKERNKTMKDTDRETLLWLRHKTYYLELLINRATGLVNDCSKALTQLQTNGRKLDSDDLNSTINNLDIYGDYLSEIMADTVKDMKEDFEKVFTKGA